MSSIFLPIFLALPSPIKVGLIIFSGFGFVVQDELVDNGEAQAFQDAQIELFADDDAGEE